MNKHEVITSIIFFVIIVICGVLIAFSILTYESTRKTKTRNALKSIIEQAYFEGQKDALEGDVRIQKIGDKYIWIKSPWDDNESFDKIPEQ